MKRKRAFTLVDTLIALMITLTGTASMIRLSGVTERAWQTHRERLIAQEIIDRLAHLDFERLAAWDTRAFDALGRPGDGVKPPFYTLEVRTQQFLYWRVHTCRLLYRDRDDRPVTLTLVRKEWQDHVQSV